jgi:hypothetical protein
MIDRRWLSSNWSAYFRRVISYNAGCLQLPGVGCCSVCAAGVDGADGVAGDLTRARGVESALEIALVVLLVVVESILAPRFVC